MKHQGTIKSDASLFLDSFRILAAFIVIVDHSQMLWSTNHELINKLHKLAHGAVIIFFVLSGYLISYTTTINNRGLKQYAAARLSRLYSVIFPALVITLIIELFLQEFDPQLLSFHSRGNSIPRYVITLIFCNEVGPLSAAPLINSPLWSLSYEFWYYFIFATFFFYKNPKIKYLILLSIIYCIFLSKILLLMPIWILGFIAYKFNKTSYSLKIGWILISCFSLATIMLVIIIPNYPFDLGKKPLYFSSSFLSDLVVGISFCLSLIVLPLRSSYIPKSISTNMRFIGDLSFPIYTLHYPIFILYQSVFPVSKNDQMQIWLAIVVTIILISLIGFFIDKSRKIWYSIFNHIVNKAKIELVYKNYATDIKNK